MFAPGQRSVAEIPATAGEADTTLRGRFEAVAARTPDAVAIADATGTLSYAAVNAYANAVARALQARGVGPGDVVAIAVERSAGTVATILGIVKAGGVYLPLDISYPRERLRYMIAQADTALVLMPHADDALDPIVDPNRVVRLDTLDLSVYRIDNVAASGHSSDLAYVMYTSGSTGRPKGVLVTQDAIVNLVTTAALTVAPSDVVAQLASLSFDAATYEIWGALLSGARLQILARDIVLDPSALAGSIRAHGISVALLTSALFRHVAQQVPHAFASLRVLIVGGDIVDPAAARAVLAHGSPGRLLNAYGPTETTTIATTYEITEPPPGAISIGRPLANVRAYILNECGAFVSGAECGELHIGGAGVARGYVNDPDRTAAVFRADPFSDVPGARMYATGDLARWNADGNLVFLGRADRQVKIRGFRVELDEIEAALNELAGVTDAVVTVRDDAGRQKIVAYVVDATRPARGIVAWRTELGRRLPAYTLPDAVIAVATMPLTANGKIDRTALAGPASVDTAATPQAECSPAEAAVCAMFGTLLDVAGVGRDDDFFALGGHSLLAARAIVRIADCFGVDLSLRTFFAGPTAARLARAIAAAPPRATPAFDGSAECRRPDRPTSTALSTAQYRLWLLEQIDPGSPAYNVPCAFALHGDLDRSALESALNGLISRHDPLRMLVRVSGGQPVWVVDEAAVLEVAAIDADRERLDSLLASEVVRPFDLSVDIPIRALLVRAAEREHVLLINIHHIATDGWSMGIFKRELGLLYAARRENARAPLDALSATYAEFARRERVEHASQAFHARLAFWTALLRDAPEPLAFARASAGDDATLPPGALRTRPLPPPTRAALTSFCRASNTTAFSVLFAAFALLLHQRTGRRDFVVGSVVANRTSTEFEAPIGFFVNTLPLRVRIAGDPAFAPWLQTVHRSTLAAFDHQDVPLQTIVQAIRPARSAGRAPLINVMFVVQNAPDAPLRLAGLDVVPVPLERGSAKFDLTLEITYGAAGEMVVGFEYRTGLFDAPTVDAMLVAYIALIAEVMRDPDRPLSVFGSSRGPGFRASDAVPSQAIVPALSPAAGGPMPAGVNEPRNETEALLQSIWAQLLGVDAVGISESFFDLGGHSLLAVRLVDMLQNRFGVRLPLATIFDRPTIAQVALALEATPENSVHRPVITYNAGGPGQPLHFFHGSIEGGFYCRAIAERFAPDRPLHAIRPQTGTDMPESIEAAAADAVAVIKRLQPRGPYLVGGFCSGGLVALEAARLLRAAGEVVVKVIVIDIPPANDAVRPLIDGIETLGRRLSLGPRRRARLSGAIARCALMVTHGHFVRERLTNALRRIAFLGRTSVHEAGVRSDLDRWMRLVESYVPRRYDGRLCCLVTGDAAQGGDRGWSRIARSLEVVTIAGDHFGCITAHIDETADKLAAAASVSFSSLRRA